MKTWKQSVFFSMVAIIALGFGFVGCDDKTPDPKVVETKYRFTGGNWYTYDLNVYQEAVSTLSENTFTVTGGGIDISYTNVYTTGGGVIPHNDDRYVTPSWAYLYSGNTKIGIIQFVIIIYPDMPDFPDQIVHSVFLGKTGLENIDLSLINPIISDVQDTINGRASCQKSR